MSSSRKYIDNRHASVKQTERAGSPKAIRAQRREKRLQAQMIQTTTKLSGLDIMRVRQRAAKSTLPTMRRVRKWQQYQETHAPKK